MNTPTTRAAHELLSCPFCDGKASVEQIETNIYDTVRFSVGCEDESGECYGYQSMTSFARRSDAIAAWNTRAITTLLADKALVEEMAEAICEAIFARGAQDKRDHNAAQAATPLDKELETIVEALERLAKLGNGEYYGNSVGNSIAIEALRQAPALLARVKELEARSTEQPVHLCPLVVDELIGACEKMKEWAENQFSDTDYDLNGCMAKVHAEFSNALYHVRKYYREPAPIEAELATLKATQTAFVSENTMRESFTMRSRQDGVSNSRAICIGPGETGQFDDRLKAQQGAVIEKLEALKMSAGGSQRIEAYIGTEANNDAVDACIAIIRQCLPIAPAYYGKSKTTDPDYIAAQRAENARIRESIDKMAIAPAEGGAVKFLETIKSCKGMLPNQFIMAPQWVFDKVARGENLTAADLRFCFSSKWDEDAPPAPTTEQPQGSDHE